MISFKYLHGFLKNGWPIKKAPKEDPVIKYAIEFEDHKHSPNC